LTRSPPACKQSHFALPANSSPHSRSAPPLFLIVANIRFIDPQTKAQSPQGSCSPTRTRSMVGRKGSTFPHNLSTPATPPVLILVYRVTARLQSLIRDCPWAITTPRPKFESFSACPRDPHDRLYSPSCHPRTSKTSTASQPHLR
jgi:hypothetical protein